MLRGDVQINNHCYETQDLEMQIRNSREFGFEIGAFHHALDAYRVPDLLKNAPGNITIATFANLWGYKKEAFQASPYAGKILTDAGVPLAYKSDHPVTNSQHLLYQSQLATHFDLSDQFAIKAVTSVPARSLGLGHRIGYVRSGYDADLVLWDSYPLDLGARPIQVFVDGAAQFDFHHEKLTSVTSNHEPWEAKATESVLAKDCVPEAKDFVITGIRADFAHKASASSSNDGQGILVVMAGEVVCRGPAKDCAALKSEAINTRSAVVINVEDGVVTNGITTTAPNLGLGEIGAESSTQDGDIDASKPSDPSTVVTAFDGLVFGGPHFERAEKLGVSEVIVAPGATVSAPGDDGGFLQGISTAFKLSGMSVLDPHAVVRKQVALNFQIGDGSKGEKGSGTESISMQIRTLRGILTDQAGKDNVYGQLANGSLPFVIEVHSSDEMAHLILLKQEFPSVYMVFKGATEAYILADEIAKAEIPVLAYPRCMPSSWRTRRCLPGPPMSDDTNISALLRANVKLGLIANDDGNLGEMYWEAAWAAKLVNEASDELQLSEQDTIDLVSRNVREILRLPEIKPQDFVVFSGSPLHVKSQIALTVDAGAIRYCQPRLQ
ncbi:Putative uncharacterized protein [Taphrina deformans PYCC 5710]|uniref:Amidohydrolase-related domain-containing protein n=1 Tax=Taphrina deformans (strain PYCC 5710 / ATCC 11124 / CBS 356.35 / IMI 108563 / JCM 9778 / NBRC 8474) TaxID=1097556 RepID=R4XAS0_TAPDE|nr:Putative uncharacterized protein [Taphrina deformans PYCC 5710]|eukprot:CCG82913.1 Putative uncharacterized protein [Taphrina deformans PYCC 5710]